MRAAAIMRGEKVPPIGEPMDIGDLLDFDRSVPEDGAPMTSDGGTMTETRVFPKIKVVDAFTVENRGSR